MGAALARALPPGATVSLEGPLGAGKTVLVRGLCEALGVTDPVTSPTYTLANEYDTAGARCPLIHIDAYRLPEGDDLSSIGWDHMTDGTAIIVIEWAERVRGVLPAGCAEVDIEHEGDRERVIRLSIPRPT